MAWAKWGILKGGAGDIFKIFITRFQQNLGEILVYPVGSKKKSFFFID